MRRLYIVLLIALLSFQLPASTTTTTTPNTLPGELLLGLRPGTLLSPTARATGAHAVTLNQALGAAGASIAQTLGPNSNSYRVRVGSGVDLGSLIGTLSNNPAVAYAEPNAVRSLLRTSEDPVVGQQWALRNIQAAEAWDITTGGPIIIAILDTGVSASHPDLEGRVLPGYDFFNNDADASDDNGHGTYDAGVAAADGANGEGIAGVCWGCLILPVKVLGSRGQGSDAGVAAGIRWAADQGARIISMSLGGDEESAALRDAVAYAHERNALVIAASGNGQAEGNRPNYPAAYASVLAVSATDGTDTVTGFSTTGDFVDISAPGVGVWSTVWDPEQGNTYAAANGTSASCPHVAGAAALALTLRPDLSADQLALLLTQSADDRGAPGKDPENGYGRLNLFRVVQMASDPNLSLTPPAPVASGAFAPVGPPSDDARYFSETAHTLRGEFRSYWEQHGGLPIFGFPISEAFTERGEDGRDYTVQYFERHRFELHPENRPPYNVLLSRIGVGTLEANGRNWTQFPKGTAQTGCLFFFETGQSVCEPFLSYWRTHGLEFDGQRGKSSAESLALFGLPLSAPTVETLSNGRTVTVQWFERARFEDHGQEGVLLGLLSSDLARQRGAIP